MPCVPAPEGQTQQEPAGGGEGQGAEKGRKLPPVLSLQAIFPTCRGLREGEVGGGGGSGGAWYLGGVRVGCMGGGVHTKSSLKFESYNEWVILVQSEVSSSG